MSAWLVAAGSEPARSLIRLMADGVVEGSAAIALRTFARTLHRLQKGKALVGVVGIGGAGKSTFAKVISGQSALHELPVDYDADLTHQTVDFKNLDYLRVLTIAGQDPLATRGHATIAKEIASLRRLVLINVVSFGHSATPRTMTRPQFEMYQNEPGKTFDELVASHFLRQRVQEQLHLAQMTASFTAMKANANWAVRVGFVTIILKQDLWWNEQDQVHRHYSGGAYGQCVQDLEAVFGGFEFKDLLSTSLQPLNLQLTDGALLKATCAGYDRRAQELNWINTVTRLEEIKLWAAG